MLRTSCKNLSGDDAPQPRVRGLVRGNLLLLLALLLVWLPVEAPGSGPAPEADLPHLKRSVLTHYATVVATSYQDCLATAARLKVAVNLFIDHPSEAALNVARDAWLAARSPYSQTEAFRFYDGPIDQVEPLLNAWPIDENYIDQVIGSPDSGVINAVSKFPELSREVISDLNGKEGEKNISAGFHAIEFLLWGQDTNAAGPGNRSWRDFSDEAKNGERRRQYLRIITDLLQETLQGVAAEWADGSGGNYRAQFLAMEPDEALGKILKGIGALSGPELAGERLTSPYETKEQEEEQDCFSDNTRNDIIDNAIGVQNVYLGRYVALDGHKTSGPGLHDLLARLNPEFAAKLAAQIETSVVCARNIPQPFDQAILGADTRPGRIAVRNAAKSLQTQSDLIVRAAKILSIKLNI